MNKEPNVYSFADECYVYYGDYKKDLQEKDKEIKRLTAESTEWESKCYKYQDIINELEKYHIKSMENLKNTEYFKYVGTNYIKILYEEHKRTLDKLKQLKEDK